MATKKKVQTGGSAEREAGPGFEEALDRLEKIVAEMEAGELGLEEMIGRFEEGRKLIGLCTRKLNEVERKIEVLVKQGDDYAAEPFEQDGPAPAVAPSPDGSGDASDELF